MNPTWEARMAARAKERRAADERAMATYEQEQLAAARGPNYHLTPQLPWLNGWRRLSRDIVAMANYYACIGCGAGGGSCWSIALEEDYQPPPQPVWPFGFEDCPVCHGKGPNEHLLASVW